MNLDFSAWRWAPWWVYVAVIAPANVGKEAFLADDVAWWVRPSLTVAILAIGLVVVTAIFRGSSRAVA
jgi:hypothetical protein